MNFVRNLMKEIKSSYQQNNYGLLFEAIIRIYKPEHCLELGCLNGYSGIHIARGLKKNKNGKLLIIDLFEDYPYNKCSLKEAKENFAKYKVLDFVKFIKGDVFEECKKIPFTKIDFLHIDISNTGENLRKIFEILYQKFFEKTIIIFEGGSEERDKVEWMRKYKKEPITNFIESKFFKRNFDYFVFEPFPSLTICRKK